MINQPDKIFLPKGKKNLLLHTCCAPCSGDIMLRLINSSISFSLFFYNPNIHPKKEYLLRKDENINFAIKYNIPIIDAEYDTSNWFKITRGMEWEPERGQRCDACFDMRLLKTAQYASEHHFDLISTTLGISRWKDFSQINRSGLKSASLFGNVDYWDFNWRKNNGSQNMITVSKQENFYMQEYCGCIYSLRDTNEWRLKNNKSKIEFGIKYYSFSDKDPAENQ